MLSWMFPNGEEMIGMGETGLTDAQSIFPYFPYLFKIHFKGRIDWIGGAEQDLLLPLMPHVPNLKSDTILLGHDDIAISIL